MSSIEYVALANGAIVFSSTAAAFALGVLYGRRKPLDSKPKV